MVAAWTTLLVVLAAFCTISNANKRNETELNNRLLSDIINWAIEIYDKVPEGRIFEGVANNQELIRKLEGIFKTYPGRDIYIKRISSGFNDERLNDEINNLTNALEHHRKEIRVLTSISETEIEDTVERTWKLIHDMSNIEGFSDGVISIASSLMK